MTHQNDLLDQKNGKNKQIDLEIEFDHFIDIIKNFMAIRNLNMIDELCQNHCDTIPFNSFKCPLDYWLK